MEFPEPTIDVEVAASDLRLELPTSLRALLAQAWEEGRWSPPAACANPYGQPAAPLPPATPAGQVQFAGTPLLRLRGAAQAALAWIENMATTVPRTTLAEQLRSALGGK